MTHPHSLFNDASQFVNEVKGKIVAGGELIRLCEQLEYIASSNGLGQATTGDSTAEATASTGGYASRAKSQVTVAGKDTTVICLWACNGCVAWKGNNMTFKMPTDKNIMGTLHRLSKVLQLFPNHGLLIGADSMVYGLETAFTEAAAAFMKRAQLLGIKCYDFSPVWAKLKTFVKFEGLHIPDTVFSRTLVRETMISYMGLIRADGMDCITARLTRNSGVLQGMPMERTLRVCSRHCP